jgi:hypothetical protein
MKKHFLWLATVVAAFSLTSCGAGTALTGLGDSALNPAPIAETGGLPAFPVETGPRTAAATGDSITLLGNAAIQQRNATVDGDAMVVGPSETENESAYGLYRFSGLAGKSPTALTVNAIQGDLEQSYYVGLADFSDLRWRWFGPITLPEYHKNFEGDSHRYISALGNMYMLVVTHGANVARHESSTLTFGETPPSDPTQPGAPTNLVASDGTYADSVHLSWQAGDGAQWYRVFRKSETPNGAVEWNFIGESQTTEFADLDVASDHVYYYKVNAARQGANGQVLYSGFSNVDSGYSHSQGGGDGLDAPTGLVATDGNYADKVRVEWNAVTGAGWYRLYRLANPTGDDWQFRGESEVPSFDDLDVEPRHVYAYKVQAAAQTAGGIIQSAFSNSDTGYAAQGNGDGLAAPTGLVATDGTYQDKVRLEWNASVGAGWYRVFRLNPNGQLDFIGESQTASYNDFNVVAGQTYNYRVMAAATNPAGGVLYSDYSNDDNGYAAEGGGTLDTPQNLVATDGTYTDKVRVEWGAVTGAGWYRLYRRLDGSNEPYDLVGESQTNSFDDLGVDLGGVYLYKVQAAATGAGGTIIYSEWSNIDSGFLGDGNPGQ